MDITMDIRVGQYPGRAPRQRDMEIQIDILRRVIAGEVLSAGDLHQLEGVKSILEGIKKKLNG